MSSQEVRLYSADSQAILMTTYTQKALVFAYYLKSFVSFRMTNCSWECHWFSWSGQRIPKPTRNYWF